MNLQKTISSFDIPQKESASEYFIALSGFLSKAPYNLSVNWKNNLGIFNTNRKYSDFSNETVQEANGTILEAYTNKVVCYSFNVIMNSEESTEDFSNNWNDYRIERLVDGAVLRVYYYGDSWHVATLKCIDAGDAHWSSNKNFKELFNEAALESGLNYDTLNKNYCYTFIVKHPSNHMIVKYETSSLVHLNTVNLETCQEVDHDIGIQGITTVSFDTYEDFCKDLAVEYNAVFTESTNLGYILTNIKTGSKTKFENVSYNLAKRLKGNVPNIHYQILTLMREDWNNEEMSNKVNFLNFFPQYEEDYKFMEERFNKTMGFLYKCYMNLNNRQYNQQLDFVIQHTINEIYLTSQEQFRGNMTYDNMCKFIKRSTCERLSHILKVPIILRKNKNKKTFIKGNNRFNQGFEWQSKKTTF